MAKPRTWYAADANFLADPKVEELGLEFGPSGPLTIVALHGLAKHLETQLEPGQAGSSWAHLARRTFTDVQFVKDIVVRSVQLGLLENEVEVSLDKFVVRFPHWSEWQRTPDPGNAERCRRYRERRVEPEPEHPSAPIESSFIKHVFLYWQEVCGHPTAKLTPARAKAIRARLREGYTPDRLMHAIDGCAASAFHQGDNDQGRKYDDLTLICRNGEKVEAFEAIPGKSAPPEDEGTEEMYK